MSQSREMLSSRLGFLLLSAGCAIGLGNVWRFPYITGAYGGAVFVGVYLLCLLAVLPVMIMEFAVGRASRSNMGRALKVLPPEGTRWHIFSKIPLWGSYLLSMFYTTVTGWMLAYCWHSFSGNLSGLDTAGVASFFGSTLASPFEQVLGMTIVVGVGCLICAMGVQKGVERVVKVIMVGLLAILVLLVVRSLTLPGRGRELLSGPGRGEDAERGLVRRAQCGHDPGFLHPVGGHRQHDHFRQLPEQGPLPDR